MDTYTSGRLALLAQALVDCSNARVLVPAQQASTGYWFGGGNILHDEQGFVLCGRYRNFGDSRTGVGVGERGLELAVFRSPDFTAPFDKQECWSKADLSNDASAVVSIEGASLYAGATGLELYVSTEKAMAYPEPLAAFQKPGTGVWSIDRLVDGVLEPVLSSATGETLHVKDPDVFAAPNGDQAMIFCSHPFAWSSSNTGLALRPASDASFAVDTWDMLPRGKVWDVACTRVTDRLSVPRLGVFADLPPVSLYFYDGAECLRSLDENPAAARRPRGYSCEELGGLAWGWDAEFPRIQRVSVDGPAFISPHGTGCNRYVGTCATDTGLYATWQQSQPDLSQPLMGHALSMEQVDQILQ
jgi:hypothetical protein